MRSKPNKRTIFSCLQFAQAWADFVPLFFPVRQAMFYALAFIVRTRTSRLAVAQSSGQVQV